MASREVPSPLPLPGTAASPAGPACRAAVRRPLAGLCLALTAAGAAAAETAGLSALHLADGYEVELVAEPAAGPAEAEPRAPFESGATGHYTIVLSEQGVPFLRFGGRLAGRPVRSWLSDLDGDGDFEVVLTTVSGNGDGRIYIQEWVASARALVPLTLQPLDAALQARHRGGDRYRVEDDTLYRSFPDYPPEGGPGAEADGRLELRYDFAAGRWEREKRFLFF